MLASFLFWKRRAIETVLKVIKTTEETAAEGKRRVVGFGVSVTETPKPTGQNRFRVRAKIIFRFAIISI